LTTEHFSEFFALLALACWGATITVVGLAVLSRSRRFPAASAWFDDLRNNGLWLAWFVALVTTLGSLYFSEVAHFTPCKLCWYQRIAMYPLAIVLLVSALRRDRGVVWYVAPVATIGALIAAYHTQLQAFPHQHSSFCTLTEPCTVRYVWEFGFISLPFMALTAFVFIITMTTVAASAEPLRSTREQQTTASTRGPSSESTARDPAATRR
jgi:disulfide bond formation protein DsbB